jgi:hypothetical protein
MKGSTMNVSSRKRLFASVIAIVGLLMMLGQTSAFAQSSALRGQDFTPSVTIGQQILNGGLYQQLDAAIAPCSGQCETPNWQTGQCTCWQGFIPVEIARMLVDVTGGQCGSRLFACILQQE